ncbi:MAG: hypothetical protein V9E88_17325 [Ferruginibacter sp.]
MICTKKESEPLLTRMHGDCSTRCWFQAAWLNKDQPGYHYSKQVLFNREFLVQKTGKYRGYSKRTWDGITYNYGYSDHFPVYVMMLKKVN